MAHILRHDTTKTYTYIILLAFTFLAFFINPAQQDEDHDYLALAAVAKDFPQVVREWADYHLAIGFQKIYIFDSDNPNPAGMILQDLIDAGKVEYFNMPRVNPRTVPVMQVRVYNIAIQHLKKKHTWIGFWDIDEFLAIIDPSITSLKDYLKEFEDYGGLVVNWRLMGNSGRREKPKSGVIESYTKCVPTTFPDNALVKTIVHAPSVWVPTTDPHHFVYNNGRYAVTTNYQRVDGPATLPSHVRHDKLMLQHYAIKSEEEFRVKMKRGTGMGNFKDWAFYQHINGAAMEDCPLVLDGCKRARLKWCKIMQNGTATE